MPVASHRSGLFDEVMIVATETRKTDDPMNTNRIERKKKSAKKKLQAEDQYAPPYDLVAMKTQAPSPKFKSLIRYPKSKQKGYQSRSKK